MNPAMALVVSRWLLGAGLGWALAMAGACGGGEPSSSRDPKVVSAEAADATYRRYCIGCHGSDGRGNAGMGADFTLPGGPLATKADAELIASVRDGKRGQTATMPAHSPVLSDAQIAAVVSLVKQRFAPH
jgi:mono/diheme cytochrome c family protein